MSRGPESRTFSVKQYNRWFWNAILLDLHLGFIKTKIEYGLDLAAGSKEEGYIFMSVSLCQDFARMTILYYNSFRNEPDEILEINSSHLDESVTHLGHS